MYSQNLNIWPGNIVFLSVDIGKCNTHKVTIETKSSDLSFLNLFYRSLHVSENIHYTLTYGLFEAHASTTICVKTYSNNIPAETVHKITHF